MGDFDRTVFFETFLTKNKNLKLRLTQVNQAQTQFLRNKAPNYILSHHTSMAGVSQGIPPHILGARGKNPSIKLGFKLVK